MKEEWKPEELRAASEEIRGAVMPKSITPEMVGGTMLGVVNALGEVVEVLGEIPREQVKVKVHGCDCNGLVSTLGATVDVDVFNVQGFPMSRLLKTTLETDENCEVTFEVPHGFTFSVVAKCAGMGASFQLVYDASRVRRTIDLWLFPVGVFWYGQAELYDQSQWRCPSIPFLSEQYCDDYEIDMSENGAQSWVNEYVRGLSESEDLEYEFDQRCWRGVLVSTADTAFVIMPDNLSEERVIMSDVLGLGNDVPFCNCVDLSDVEVAEGESRWDKAAEMTLTDFEGHANTVKLLKYCVNPIAAKAATWRQYIWLDDHSFLPSAGQLYLMYQNRTAINAIMTAARADEWNFKLLPYQDAEGHWHGPNGVTYECWWSSTQSEPDYAWTVQSNGLIYPHEYDCAIFVRAVTVFDFH